MRTIYRYEASIIGPTEIHGPPIGPITRAVVTDDLEHLEFWADVDTDAGWIVNDLVVLGTGHEIPDVFNLAVTADRVRGYVWHIAYRSRPAVEEAMS